MYGVMHYLSLTGLKRWISEIWIFACATYDTNADVRSVCGS